MRNYWKAKLCHGCIYLHIGKNVDHNHCDASGDAWENHRVSGHHLDLEDMYHKTKCIYREVEK